MVQNISFGSTYKVTNTANTPGCYSQFKYYAESIANNDGVRVTTKGKDEYSYYGYMYKSTYTVVAPDSMDEEIETFCANRGINYKKHANYDLLNTKNIYFRIRRPEKGMRKVNINVDKLEELAKTQETNFKFFENEYREYFVDYMDAMIKSGERIPASTLFISSTMVEPDINGVTEKLKEIGADKIRKNEIFLDFVPMTDEQDQFMYYALKDLGMKQIPLYMNEESYNAAVVLGLIEDDPNDRIVYR